VKELLRELVPVLCNTGATQQSWLIVIRSGATRQGETEERNAAGSNDLLVNVARFLRVDPDFRWAETLVVPEPLERRIDFDDAVRLVGGKSIAVERSEVAGTGLQGLGEEAVKHQRVSGTVNVGICRVGQLRAGNRSADAYLVHGGNCVQSRRARTGSDIPRVSGRAFHGGYGRGHVLRAGGSGYGVGRNADGAGACAVLRRGAVDVDARYLPVTDAGSGDGGVGQRASGECSDEHNQGLRRPECAASVLTQRENRLRRLSQRHRCVAVEDDVFLADHDRAEQ